MTQTESDSLAFVNYVMGEANRIVIEAGTGGAFARWGVSDVAAQKHRQLMSLPEPDPTVCCDEDCHANWSERLPGEPRREKGESFAKGLDLSALTPNRN